MFVALTGREPALLGQAGSNSGESWKYAETASHVSVQRCSCVCSTEDLSQVRLVVLTFLFIHHVMNVPVSDVLCSACREMNTNECAGGLSGNYKYVVIILDNS